jgi:hypothetical protein
MRSIILPNDKTVHAGVKSDLWWLGDDLATGVDDQIDPPVMLNCPEHDLGQNETIRNERQINTGWLVIFTNQINICTFDTSSEAGGSMVATMANKDNKMDSNLDDEQTTAGQNSDSEDEEDDKEAEATASVEVAGAAAEAEV